MDRLEAMQVFAAAVESGSLSAAGRKLGMPLATVSRKLSELEAHIKTRLLVRSTRKLSLTDAGQAYLVACKRILEEVGEAERIASGEYRMPKGELIITAPIVLGRLHVVPVISEFLQGYPDVDIRLVLGDRMLSLPEDHIDAAVRVGELPDSSLIAIRIGHIHPVICASPVYLAARGTPRTLEQLAGHDCIAFSGLMPADGWTFQGPRSEVVVPMRPRLVVNTAEAAIDAALAGAGLTRVLSYQVRDAVREGRLSVILKKFEPAPVPVNLVHMSRGLQALKLRAFIDFALPRMKARLA